jgi:hypothetical protein
MIKACETRPGAAPPAGDGGISGDLWATAEDLAEVAQSVAVVKLTAAARAELVRMTVELLTVLTCWPSAARPANALAYLRSRGARMARHVVWFYELPRPVRWLLTGKGLVPSLLASAVCVAPISEEQRRAWGRALVTLNGLVDLKPAGAPVPAPLV